MPHIVASPTPTTCTPWCTDGTGHSDATLPAELRCRSYLHRLDSTIGGGRDGDQAVTSSGGIYLQAEQTIGEPPTFTLGIELGGTETWITLQPAELRTLLADASALLDEAVAA